MTTKITIRSTKMIPPITPPMTGPAATELEVLTTVEVSKITHNHIHRPSHHLLLLLKKVLGFL